MSENTIQRSAVGASSHKRRLARVVGATAIAGGLAAGVVGLTAPANAAVTPPAGNLPGCVLPAGVHWQLQQVFVRPFLSQQIIVRSVWGASASGHTYAGRVLHIATPPDTAVAEGLGAYVTCTVS